LRQTHPELVEIREEIDFLQRLLEGAAQDDIVKTSPQAFSIVIEIEARIMNINRRLLPSSTSASPELQSQDNSVAHDFDKPTLILGDDVLGHPPKEEVKFNSSMDGDMADYQAYLTFCHEECSRNERPAVSFAEYVTIAKLYGKQQEETQKGGEENEVRHVARGSKGKERAE